MWRGRAGHEAAMRLTVNRNPITITLCVKIEGQSFFPHYSIHPSLSISRHEQQAGHCLPVGTQVFNYSGLSQFYVRIMGPTGAGKSTVSL